MFDWLIEGIRPLLSAMNAEGIPPRSEIGQIRVGLPCSLIMTRMGLAVSGKAETSILSLCLLSYAEVRETKREMRIETQPR